MVQLTHSLQKFRFRLGMTAGPVSQQHEWGPQGHLEQQLQEFVVYLLPTSGVRGLDCGVTLKMIRTAKRVCQNDESTTSIESDRKLREIAFNGFK